MKAIKLCTFFGGIRPRREKGWGDFQKRGQVPEIVTAAGSTPPSPAPSQNTLLLPPTPNPGSHCHSAGTACHFWQWTMQHNMDHLILRCKLVCTDRVAISMQNYRIHFQYRCILSKKMITYSQSSLYANLLSANLLICKKEKLPVFLSLLSTMQVPSEWHL